MTRAGAEPAPPASVAPSAASASPGADLGQRLRAARAARRMSLEEVARAAGVTKGFVSRLERGRANASVAVLVRVCAALDLAVGSLFEPAPAGAVLRASDRPLISFGGHGLAEHLLTPRGEQRLAVIHSDISPGGGGGDEPYALPADVEFCLVLAGRIDLAFPVRREVVTLEEGDSLTFDPGELHTFTGGDAGARVLWVISPGALAPRGGEPPRAAGGRAAAAVAPQG